MVSSLTKNVDLSGLEPVDLGLDGVRWHGFRPVQHEMIEYALFGPDGDGGRPVVACGAPTGSGKSLAAVAIALAAWEWRGWRTCILTATRALADQYAVRDFPFPVLADVRGRDNYDCINGGTCKENEDSCLEGKRCDYRRAVDRATDHPVVLTNYQYWLNVRGMNASALGEFQMVIADEAHEAIGELGRYLGAWTSHRDLAKWGDGLMYTGPATSGPVGDKFRRRLALMALAIRRDLPDVPERGRKTAAIKRLEDLLKNVERVLNLSASGPWLWQAGDKGVRFNPVWPGRYIPRYLARGLEKLVFLSATLRPKTLALSGFQRAAYDFKEWPRQFPPQLSPVYYWPIARMKHGDDGDWPKLVDAVKEITDARRDRKGIIHTVSYDRAKQLASALAGYRVKLCERGKVQQAADWLKAADVGAILITPSHGTGFDFPSDSAEYQIVVKLPFGNTSDPLSKAREADDPDYGLYETMQDLVQMCGRATRHDKDRSECFILDRAWPFLWSRAKQHAPAWFRVYDIQAVPKKPPKL